MHANLKAIAVIDSFQLLVHIYHTLRNDTQLSFCNFSGRLAEILSVSCDELMKVLFDKSRPLIVRLIFTFIGYRKKLTSIIPIAGSEESFFAINLVCVKPYTILYLDVAKLRKLLDVSRNLHGLTKLSDFTITSHADTVQPLGSLHTTITKYINSNTQISISDHEQDLIEHKKRVDAALESYNKSSPVMNCLMSLTLILERACAERPFALDCTISSTDLTAVRHKRGAEENLPITVKRKVNGC